MATWAVSHTDGVLAPANQTIFDSHTNQVQTIDNISFWMFFAGIYKDGRPDSSHGGG